MLAVGFINSKSLGSVIVVTDLLEVVLCVGLRVPMYMWIGWRVRG